MTGDRSPAPPVNGRWTIVAVLGAGGATLAVGSSSTPWFVVLALITLLGTAYAAFFWPRETLVGAAITTLLDPVVAARTLPAGLAAGPIGISEPLLATVGLVALTRVRRAGWITVWRDPTFALVVLFVAVASLSAIVNRIPPTVALLGVVMTVDAMAVYFVWRLLEPPTAAGVRAIAALVGAGVVVALFGIGQAVLAPNLVGFERFTVIPGDLGRITSVLGNPNLLAPVLAFLLPFPIYAAARLPGRQPKLVAAGIGLILLVALILTFSRGAWIAAAVGIAFGVIVLEWRAAVSAAVIGVLAIVVVLALPRHLLGGDADVGTGVLRSRLNPPVPVRRRANPGSRHRQHRRHLRRRRTRSVGALATRSGSCSSATGCGSWPTIPCWASVPDAMEVPQRRSSGVRSTRSTEPPSAGSERFTTSGCTWRVRSALSA